MNSLNHNRGLEAQIDNELAIKIKKLIIKLFFSVFSSHITVFEIRFIKNLGEI